MGERSNQEERVKEEEGHVRRAKKVIIKVQGKEGEGSKEGGKEGEGRKKERK